MAKTIEPPILMSRILTFVLAASIVVLGALVGVLIKMMPLERPEVFFLSTPTRSTNVIIEPLVPDYNNEIAVNNYVQGFIREYVIARNTLTQNVSATRKNWIDIVETWSSKDVLKKFRDTIIYNDYTFNDQPITFDCSVNFDSSKFLSTRQDNKEYIVPFNWICENSGGQTIQKNYKIQIRIRSELDKKVSDVVDNLEKLSRNPLGIQVVEYTVLDGANDPLDSIISD